MFPRKKYIKLQSAENNSVSKEEASTGVQDTSSPEYDPTLVVYQLGDLLQAARVQDSETPAILLAGYGSYLKDAVRAIKQAGAESIYVTGTADKERAFAFSGFAKVINLGDTFNKDLFINEYALVQAAKECGARYLLLCNPAAATELLLQAAMEADLRVLGPMPGDKSYNNWVLQRPAHVRPATAPAFEWKKCPHCKLFHEAGEVMADGGTCPTCGKLYRLTSEERIAYLFDADTFEEWNTGIPETDPLGFPGYDSLISNMREKSAREEAVRCGKAKLAGMDVALCVMETTFMMGSMGSVVGEKITRTIERATAEGLPLIIFTASGGARMQEGLVSLMQMAKTSAAIERHGRAGLPYISVITDPTTGGVTASFATEGDIIVSEPNALIGFAGRRVIEDTIRQTLPDGFQTAEFALDHGLIDAIVPREDLRSFLAHAVAIHMASVQERKTASTLGEVAPGNFAATSPLPTSAAPSAASSTEAAPTLAESASSLANLIGAPFGSAGTSASTADNAESFELFGFLPASDGEVDLRIYSYRMVEDALKDPSRAGGEGHTMQNAQPTGPMAAILPRPARTNASRNHKRGPISGVLSVAKGIAGGVTIAARGVQKVAFGGFGVGRSGADTQAISRVLSKRSVADAPGVKPIAQKESRASQTTSPEPENAAWESVLLARNVNRPTAKYYIDQIVDGFIELHGDRAFGDDGAILGGIGWIQGYPVTIIAEEKGEDLNQRIARNFGCPQPEGYRKSLRLMKQAEKFGRPIVCLVDTQGAFCGMEAEERGQGNAIAENLVALSGMDVPVISVVLGEGGSGGALALAVGNRVAMQKHAVYSVLSPEGFASILWKDRSRAAEAAAVMKMSADEACEMGIVEEVLSEGAGAAHENREAAAVEVRNFIVRSLRELSPLSPDELRNQRYARFRKF